MAGIGQKVARGVAWMMLFRVAERLLGIVSTLILVRLLAPADFGLVAMAISIIAAVEVMGAFSFDTVLIQRQDAARSHYDTAWTFNVVVASGVALTLIALAVPAAQFYEEPRLTVIVLLLALGSWVGGFENIGVVDFRKSLEFGKEFRYLMIKRLISFGTVVPLSFVFKNYWALVISTVITRFAVVATSFLIHHYRPRLSLAARHDLFNFSKWLLLNNLVLLARDRSADFTIGRLLGPHQLGLYAVSNEVATLPQQMSAPVNRAVFPGYAKHASDMSQLRASFTQVTALLWALAVPSGIGIAIIAPVLVPVVLGEQWIEAIPLLQILAGAGTIMVIQDNIAYVFYALGRPRVQMMLTLAYVVVLLPLLIGLTAALGATGAAWAHLATGAVCVPLSFAVVFRHIHLGVGTFVRAIWRVLVSTGVMALTVHSALAKLMAVASPNLPAILVACMLVGVVAYGAAMAVLWLLSGRPDGTERLLLGYALRLVPSARNRAAAATDQRLD